MSVEEAYFHYK